MHPGAVALEREDRVARRGEQVAVVADQQDGLLRRGDPRSSSSLAGTSRKLSGSSSSSTCASDANSTSSTSRLRSPPESVVAPARSPTSSSPRAHDPPAGGVPLALELVAAELRPVADRLAEPHAGAGRSAPAASSRSAASIRSPASRSRAGRRLEQQLAHRAPLSARRRRPAACTANGRRSSTSPSSAGSWPARTRNSVRLADAVGADQPDVAARRRPGTRRRRTAGRRPDGRRRGWRPRCSSSQWEPREHDGWTLAAATARCRQPAGLGANPRACERRDDG